MFRRCTSTFLRLTGVLALLVLVCGWQCDQPGSGTTPRSCAPPTFECTPIGCVTGGYCCRMGPSADICYATPAEAETECFGAAVYDCGTTEDHCPVGYIRVSWDGAPVECSRVCDDDGDCPSGDCSPLTDGSRACAPGGGADADADADADSCSGAITDTHTRTESGTFGPTSVPHEYYFTPPCVTEHDQWSRVRGVTFTLNYSTDDVPVRFSVIYDGEAFINTGSVATPGATETRSISGPTDHLYLSIFGEDGARYTLTATAEFQLNPE
jgi:hypothetical protein